MKVYWWQGGLHFEPENAPDRDALVRLWTAERVIPTGLQEPECSTQSGGVAASLGEPGREQGR